MEDAFSRIIGHGGPGYVRREGLGPEGAIAAILAAGGIPVLAHFREGPGRPDVVRELMERASAAWRSTTAHSTEGPSRRWRRGGGRLGLIPTGGSDYHGDLGPYAEATHAQLWVPPEVGDGLVALALAGRLGRRSAGSLHERRAELDRRLPRRRRAG